MMSAIRQIELCNQVSIEMSQASGGDPLSSLAEIDSADCAYKNALEEIVGVVGMSGPAGFPGAEFDVFTFRFAAWRKVGGELRTQELYVQRKTPKDTPAKTEFAKFPEGSIHRLRVLLSVDETRAILVNVLEKVVADADLEDFYQELIQPVVVDTNLFGLLTLNRRINWFEGKTMWNDEEVALYLRVDGDDDITSVLKKAECLFNSASEWDAKVRAYAALELLETVEEWRQEDDAPITKEDFMRRMKISSIVVRADGWFEIDFEDDDMFWGHYILVRGTLEKGFIDCSIAG
jgi:hypothetical protein